MPAVNVPVRYKHLMTLLSSQLAVETRAVILTRDRVKYVRRSLPACPVFSVVTGSMLREHSIT